MFPSRDGLKNSTIAFAISFLGFGVYLALAQVGLAIATINELTSPVWPAAGFAVAFLLYFGSRFAPALFLSSLASDLFVSTPAWASFGIAVTNTMAALLATALLNRIRYPFLSANDKEFNFLHFMGGILFICFVPPTFSASLGAPLITSAGIAEWNEISITWLTWWLGDALGILLVFPIVYDLFQRGPLRKFLQSPKILQQTYSMILCLILCGFVSYFIFDTQNGRPYTFLIFPLLLFGAVTLGTLGINTVIAIIGTYSVYATLVGSGPFSWSSVNENLISLQIFLFSVGLTALVIRTFDDYLKKRKVIVFLTCGWLLSGSVFHIFYTSRLQLDQSHFQSIVSESEGAILRRFRNYENILNGGVGLFLASDTVTKDDWKTFVDTIDISSKNLGANRLGYIAYVKRDDLDTYVKSMRRETPDFEIRDVPKTEFAFEHVPYSDNLRIVQYTEPIRQDQSVLGLNTGSEGRRRKGQDLARDLGKSVVSEDIILARDDRRRKGFMVYAPVYKKKHPFGTLEERRANIQGWIYAPFTYEILMNEIRKEITQQVEFFLFPHGTINRESLLYASIPFEMSYVDPAHPAQFTTRTLSIGERKYSVVWRKGSGFVTSQYTTLPWIGVFGTLLTLAATWIYINGLMYGQRADKLVRAKTRELSERELLWRTLMETIPAGVFQSDRSGNIRYVNPKWCDMTGLTATKAIGMNWMDIAHPQDLESVKYAWEEALYRRENFELQFRALNSKNEVRWITSIISRIDELDGENLGYVGVQIDATDQVRIQKQRELEQVRLAQSSKMASLGEMAGGIAHEINNPLAIIIGKSAQIKKLMSSDDLDRDRLIDGLNKIETTVDRIAKIVKGLRSFSRDSENDPMDRISITQVIEDSLALSAERFKNSGVKIETNLQDASFQGRSSQISQVLVNLLSNAFDAIEKLPERWISIDSMIKDGKLFVRVTDSGTGIPDAILAKLTQPFFTTKGVGKGTGLGLSISKQIIENHGGSLNYELRDGHTSFKIELPLSRIEDKI